MRYCIKTKQKKHKGKTYKYYEVHKTYRDPTNWKKVHSDFVAYLGKDKKAGLQKLKDQTQIERLTRFVELEMKRAGNTSNS